MQASHSQVFKETTFNLPDKDAANYQRMAHRLDLGFYDTHHHK